MKDKITVVSNRQKRMARPQIARIIPDFKNDNDSEICRLLRSLTPFQTGAPPGIIIPEVITPSDWR